jgi:carotenoid cleavage dioxygenase
MMHDFAITERFSLFLDGNVAYDLSLLEKGYRIPIRWFEERRARLGVIPRAGGEVRWFPIAPCFLQHVANAYELPADQAGGERIVFDVIRYETFLRLDEAKVAFLDNPLGQLWRYEIDMATGTVHERAVTEANMEMPRINEARTGRRHRYVYGVLQPTDREMRGVVKVDVDTGQQWAFVPPVGDQNSEPIFVPDPARAEAEDGGWLLFCVYRAQTDTSDLVVLDAQSVERPPVATVPLPRRIPAGFHGAWMPDRRIRDQRPES